MYINFIGIPIIALGFATPYLTQGLFPCVIFFWLGLLVLMNPNDNFKEINTWFKYGRVGLLVNAISLSLWLVSSNYILYEISGDSILPFWLPQFINFIVNPISSLAEKINPKPMIDLADGTVSVIFTYKRIVLTSFFNSLFFVAMGMLIGKLLSNKRKAC